MSANALLSQGINVMAGGCFPMKIPSDQAFPNKYVYQAPILCPWLCMYDNVLVITYFVSL